MPPVEQIMRLGPVIPVLVLDDPGQGVSVARALVEGGLRVIEVTLRTPSAWEIVRAIQAEVQDAVVGVGTVTKAAELDEAVRRGVRFAVSPGITDRLLVAAAASGLPFLPGVATVGEAMRALDAGFRHLKLFPAAAAGGPELLRAIAGPLPLLRFCPTGGIREHTAAEYLRLSSVLCVGGTWLTPPEAVAARDWITLTAGARRACKLSRFLSPSAAPNTGR
jgi:2-dehydro-3-deoxyphosphogluconate aldolase/(4S)-4-hydroxy-2-oxoglutarate aldolase